MRLIYIPSLILLALAFLTGNLSKGPDLYGKYDSSKGREVVHVSPDKEVEETLHKTLIYPGELYYGDMAYLVVGDVNITDNVLYDFPRAVADCTNLLLSVDVFCDEISCSYKRRHEFASILDADGRSVGHTNVDVKPGEIVYGLREVLDFPPLEDWNNQFWREVREKMTPEGIKCELRIRSERCFAGRRSTYETFTQPILIKPRSQNEMKLLEEWYKDTPESLFPISKEDSSIPHVFYLQSSGKSDVFLGWKDYDPWMFIRVGNRKPSDPNNPRTLNGWRSLEEKLVPSVLRDEVHFTRFQLEFYNATSVEKRERVKAEFAAWLKDLPEAQRLVLTTSLASAAGKFSKTNLREKYLELLNFLKTEGLLDGEGIRVFESYLKVGASKVELRQKLN